MIFDVTILILLGHHEPRPYKKVNLINALCVMNTPGTGRSPITLSLHLPILSDTTVLKLGHLVTLQWPLGV